MSLLANGTISTYQCPVCGAKVTQLRRGRCISCYNKWAESQPIALGASCRICGEKRKENLERVELLGRWFYMCHNCAYKAVRLDPMPKHIEGIRARLLRDRRFTDRRVGKEDTRKIKRERRVGERRAILIDDNEFLYEEDMFLDYDYPIEGEVTGVFQKIDFEDLKNESDSDENSELKAKESEKSDKSDKTTVDKVEKIEEVEEVELEM